MNKPISDQPLLRIGEIADFLDVSVKAVRIYEKMEIILPAKVDKQSGYRYYHVDQIHSFRALLELKALGFTLKEIRHILTENINSGEYLQELVKKQIFWREMILAAQSKIEALDQIIKRTETNEQIQAPELTEEQRAWLLVKLACVEDIRGKKTVSEALWL